MNCNLLSVCRLHCIPFACKLENHPAIHLNYHSQTFQMNCNFLSGPGLLHDAHFHYSSNFSIFIILNEFQNTFTHESNVESFLSWWLQFEIAKSRPNQRHVLSLIYILQFRQLKIDLKKKYK